MRVLYVSASDGPHDRRMIEAWGARGVVVTRHIVSAADPDLESVRSAITRSEPDVVQAGPIPDVAHAVRRVWSGPLIATSWGFDLLSDVDTEPGAASRAKGVLAAADAVIVDNDAVRDRALSLGAPAEALVQFPWGVDHAQFSPDGPDLREELGIPESAVCILSVRRHEPLYDVPTVVRAFSRISGARADAVLVLAGEGSQTALLHAMVEEAALQEKVRFVGELRGERLAALYRTADLYVSSSSVDGSSISLLEAMASGAVPVVTDIPGNRQWVPEDVGARFPVGDDGRLAAALARLAGDMRGREARAMRAISLSRTEADWTRGAAALRSSADLAVSRHRSGRHS